MYRWLATTVLNWFGGPVIKGFLEGYKAKLDATNNTERMATDLALEEIQADIDARKNVKEVRLATKGFWEMRLMTFAIAFPFVTHLWFVWMDTQFGLWQRGGMFERCWTAAERQVCGVPAFPDPFNEWQGAILLSFFGIYTLGKTVQAGITTLALRRK